MFSTLPRWFGIETYGLILLPMDRHWHLWYSHGWLWLISHSYGLAVVSLRYGSYAIVV